MQGTGTIGLGAQCLERGEGTGLGRWIWGHPAFTPAPAALRGDFQMREKGEAAQMALQTGQLVFIL